MVTIKLDWDGRAWVENCLCVVVGKVWNEVKFMLVEGLNGRRFVYAVGVQQGNKSGEGVDVE